MAKAERASQATNINRHSDIKLPRVKHRIGAKLRRAIISLGRDLKFRTSKVYANAIGLDGEFVGISTRNLSNSSRQPTDLRFGNTRGSRKDSHFHHSVIPAQAGMTDVPAGCLQPPCDRAILPARRRPAPCRCERNNICSQMREPTRRHLDQNIHLLDSGHGIG